MVQCLKSSECWGAIFYYMVLFCVVNFEACKERAHMSTSKKYACHTIHVLHCKNMSIISNYWLILLVACAD